LVPGCRRNSFGVNPPSGTLVPSKAPVEIGPRPALLSPSGRRQPELWRRRGWRESDQPRHASRHLYGYRDGHERQYLAYGECLGNCAVTIDRARTSDVNSRAAGRRFPADRELLVERAFPAHTEPILRHWRAFSARVPWDAAGVVLSGSVPGGSPPASLSSVPCKLPKRTAAPIRKFCRAMRHRHGPAGLLRRTKPHDAVEKGG